MYIRKVHIENIRSIATLDWEVPSGKEAGWHVVIGDNGSGKTTLLRAIALALVGASEAMALRENWKDWLRNGEKEGRIRLSLDFDPRKDAAIMFASSRPGSWEGTEIFFEIILSRSADGVVNLTSNSNGVDPSSPLWGRFPSGWFSAAYGPFRRFSGGDAESEKIFSSHSRLAAHLSIFGENIALTECVEWLKELKYKKLEKDPAGNLLDRIVEFINQNGFLPHQARLTDVSSSGVFFVDGEGHRVPVEGLSDGYRSVLSMTFELIRQMARVYALDGLFDQNGSSRIVAPGVVLIDEVDAHLHPTWQRSIGLWFRKHFPNLQFIVTTHSPLICQAADVGTVWRLPKPGSGESPEQITGVALNRLLYGNVLDAYGTELFGEDVTRSDESLKKLERLAELNRKELRGKLTAKEREEQTQLRATLPTASHVLAEER